MGGTLLNGNFPGGIFLEPYCDYKSKSFIYIKSIMGLLRIRNQQRIIYNKVLDNRVKTGAPSIYI